MEVEPGRRCWVGVWRVLGVCYRSGFGVGWVVRKALPDFRVSGMGGVQSLG